MTPKKAPPRPKRGAKTKTGLAAAIEARYRLPQSTARAIAKLTEKWFVASAADAAALRAKVAALEALATKADDELRMAVRERDQARAEFSDMTCSRDECADALEAICETIREPHGRAPEEIAEAVAGVLARAEAAEKERDEASAARDEEERAYNAVAGGLGALRTRLAAAEKRAQEAEARLAADVRLTDEVTEQRIATLNGARQAAEARIEEYKREVERRDELLHGADEDRKAAELERDEALRRLRTATESEIQRVAEKEAAEKEHLRYKLQREEDLRTIAAAEKRCARLEEALRAFLRLRAQGADQHSTSMKAFEMQARAALSAEPAPAAEPPKPYEHPPCVNCGRLVLDHTEDEKGRCGEAIHAPAPTPEPPEPWRCAHCGWRGPVVEGSEACGQCKSEDVFPANDGQWPEDIAAAKERELEAQIAAEDAPTPKPEPICECKWGGGRSGAHGKDCPLYSVALSRCVCGHEEFEHASGKCWVGGPVMDERERCPCALWRPASDTEREPDLRSACERWEFVGPCAHGSDPWTRCDEGCAEGTELQAAVAAAVEAERAAILELVKRRMDASGPDDRRCALCLANVVMDVEARRSSTEGAKP